MLGLNGKLLDFIYPVGSYYETSDTSFNPNTAWGGTWLEDTKGRVTVALDSEDTDFDTLGKTGGSKYLQNHIHSQVRWYNQAISYDTGTGAHYQGSLGINNGSGKTSVNMTTGGVNDITTGDSGNLQPYIVVKRWHRTA